MKVFGWSAIVFVLLSYFTSSSEGDAMRQALTTSMMAVMALSMIYRNPALAPAATA